MRRINSFIGNEPIEYPQDVEGLKNNIPELKNLPDKLVKRMYEEYSDYFFSAGWMTIDADIVEHFRKWLLEDVKGE